MPLLFIQKHFVIWPRLACKLAWQKTTALLKEFPGLFTLKSLAQVKLRDDRITSCGYLRFAFTFSTSCGFLRLGFWTSCALNFLRINRNFTSFCRLRVLAAQELLAPLLARALFLGCTVLEKDKALSEKIWIYLHNLKKTEYIFLKFRVLQITIVRNFYLSLVNGKNFTSIRKRKIY